MIVTSQQNRIELLTRPGPTRYPLTVPQVTVSEPEGLDDHQVREVQENIANLTQEMLGDEMALQVAQNVSQMLADYNKAKRAVSQKRDYSSLHEAALEEQRLKLTQKMALEEEAENEDMSGLVTNSSFLSLLYVKKESLFARRANQ